LPHPAGGKHDLRRGDCNEANLVVIDHGEGIHAGHGHLTKNGALVEVGEEVIAGRVIALSGNSGLSRGPHLHSSVKACPEDEPAGGPACTTMPAPSPNTRPHPRGLIGPASSALGGGEWPEAPAASDRAFSAGPGRSRGPSFLAPAATVVVAAGVSGKRIRGRPASLGRPATS
jgi:hypothetical protein